MNSTADFQAIADLDLDAIKMKLMHKPSGEGWSADKANAVEHEYRRFLYLMKLFPNEPTAPLVDVDTFWHYHILDTLKYAPDCETVFGYFLHHYPYAGLSADDDEDAHSNMENRLPALYEATFGESYSAAAAALQQAETVAGARAAGRGATEQAFCSANSAATAQAFSSIGSAANAQAFCSATAAAARRAFCSATATGPLEAFCSAISARTPQAFCSAVSARPAAAFCSANAAANQPAFCSASTGRAANARPEHAFCSITQCGVTPVQLA